MLIRVGISCCISYSIVSYLLYAYVDQMHMLIKLLRLGKRELIFVLLFTYNFVVSIPLGTWYGLRYFVVALAGPSINYLES